MRLLCRPPPWDITVSIPVPGSGNDVGVPRKALPPGFAPSRHSLLPLLHATFPSGQPCHPTGGSSSSQSPPVLETKTTMLSVDTGTWRIPPATHQLPRQGSCSAASGPGDALQGALPPCQPPHLHPSSPSLALHAMPTSPRPSIALG